MKYFNYKTESKSQPRITAVLAFIFILFLSISGNSILDDNTNNTSTVINSTSTLPSISPSTEVSTTTQYYPVTRVVDGDTIKILMDNKIETLRLIGIDTPETVDPRKDVQCYGIEASNQTKEQLLGKRVMIELDSTQDVRDRYGRLLVYLYREDGLFFNKYMVENGFAFEYTYKTPYKYQNEFKDAEKFARDTGLGLWSPNTCNGITGTNAQ